MTDHADMIRRAEGVLDALYELEHTETNPWLLPASLHVLAKQNLDLVAERQQAIDERDKLQAELDLVQNMYKSADDADELAVRLQAEHAERQQAQEALQHRDAQIQELCDELREAIDRRRQALDALREIADEKTAGGEQTTVGASRAATIARAALVKLGEKP